MKNLKLFFTFALAAFKERLKGWRYPLIHRDHQALRFKISRERAETLSKNKLKYSNLKPFLERRGINTVLITEITEDYLWVNIYRADIVQHGEILSPCHQLAANTLKGLDGTFNFLAQAGDIRLPLRGLPAYYLNNEPVMSYKIAWTRNERDYIQDLVTLEGPYLNSDDFDLDDYLDNSERTRAVM